MVMTFNRIAISLLFCFASVEGTRVLSGFRHEGPTGKSSARPISSALSWTPSSNKNIESRMAKRGNDLSSQLLAIRGGDAQDSLLIQTGVVHSFLETIDILGTFVFAFAGAYKAGKRGMDLLGMMILASVTAIGGGTVRDLLLGTGGKAIFWLRNPIYIQISLFTTIATYLFWPKLESQFGFRDSAKIICISDAFAMAAFCVLGTKRAVQEGLPLSMWVVSGVITSIFGGITRDVLCGEPPRAMYPYKSMLSLGPILGSSVYTILCQDPHFDEDLVSTISLLVTFAVRTYSFDNPRRLPHWPEVIKEEEDRKIE